MGVTGQCAHPSIYLFWKSLPRYVSTVLTVIVCLSVCLSHTGIVSKHRITQTMPHDNPGTLVFDAKDLDQIRMGSPTMGTPNAGGVD